jgi:hypothetical protein
VNGFWDAVGRASLGLEGTALPRPRSLFEQDGPVAPDDDLEMMFEEIDAVQSTPSPAQAVIPTTTSEQPAADSERLVTSPAAAPPRDASEPVHDAVEPARSVPLPMEHLSTSVAAPEDWPVGAQLATPPAVDRIEVHQFETTRVLAESIPSSDPDESPSLAAAASAPSFAVADVTEPGGDVALRDEGRTDEVPHAALAEPRIVLSDLVPVLPFVQAAPLIIEIERIDIRIEPDRVASPAPSRRADPSSVPSLEEYLAHRGEAAR